MHREDGLLIYYARINICYSLVVSFNLHKLIQVRKSGYNTKPLFNFLALMAIYLIMSQQIGNCIQMVLLPSFQQHHNSFINMSLTTTKDHFLPLNILQIIDSCNRKISMRLSFITFTRKDIPYQILI